MDGAVSGSVPHIRDTTCVQVVVEIVLTRNAEALRRRNLRTGWILGAVAMLIALSVWYARLG